HLPGEIVEWVLVAELDRVFEAREERVVERGELRHRARHAPREPFGFRRQTPGRCERLELGELGRQPCRVHAGAPIVSPRDAPTHSATTWWKCRTRIS